jgi:hypothetical protein
MRLLSILPENSLGARLDDLLSSRFALQSLHDRVAHPEDLPPRLQYCITSLISACAWRAFRAGEAVFCAIARAPSGDNSASTADLEAYFLDNDACVYSAGVWTYDSIHGWWLNSVLNPCYDCEHGWWLGPLMIQRTAPGSTESSALLQFRHAAPHSQRIGRTG